MTLTNLDLAELLSVASQSEEGNKQKALRRASRAALTWAEEAGVLAGDAQRTLQELTSVGPYIERRIAEWLEHPGDPVEPPAIRRGFLTMAEAHATMAAHPDWMPRGDLQAHTLYSDGTTSIEAMLEAAGARGYEYLAITDHSKGLAIAHGMSEERLAAQAAEIAALNERGGAHVRAVHGIEMNLSPSGEGDMEPASLHALELVLGAFHSKLRLTDDQTSRYEAALRNPTIDVLAHPRGRIYDFRLGLSADWERVFAIAAEEDVILEIDCTLMRQDLNVELAKEAMRHGVRFSIGTDAHAPSELSSMTLGMATAVRAGIPKERIVNFGDAGAWRTRR